MLHHLRATQHPKNKTKLICLENQTKKDYDISSCKYNPDLWFSMLLITGTLKKLPPAKIVQSSAQFFP